MVKQLTEEGLFPGSRISPSRSHSPISEMGKSRVANPSLDDLEDSSCNLNPKVEGRVLEMTPEVSSRYCQGILGLYWDGEEALILLLILRNGRTLSSLYLNQP